MWMECEGSVNVQGVCMRREFEGSLERVRGKGVWEYVNVEGAWGKRKDWKDRHC